MSREQKRSLLLIAAAAVLLIGLHFVPVTGWLKLVLYLIPYLLVGGETLVDACKGIYNRQPFDENLLMAVATIGAMVLGDYPEAVSVMLFYQIGELFESYAVGRSRKNIGDLMDIRPDYANVETADGVTRVKPEQVAVGDTIVVKPGERVPLDGTVLTGTSALNMSALTGESAPVDVTEGSAVVSGSVNLSGVLRLRVRRCMPSPRSRASSSSWKIPRSRRRIPSASLQSLPASTRRPCAARRSRWRSCRQSCGSSWASRPTGANGSIAR